MAAFSVEDVFIKAVSRSIPIGQILILFGMGGVVLFSCFALLNKERLFQADVLSRPMWLRWFFEIFGRLFYVLAIALTPLSSATVILQATPIVVVSGAALVFGEKVGWRKWTAIFIGLAGVMVIVRPGTDSFSWLSILAVLGTLGFAGRDLASRAAPSTLSASILGLYGFLSILSAGVLYSIWDPAPFVLPNSETAFCFVVAVILGVVAYAGLMKAMRIGEVATVTPFRYSRLLFGLAFGVFLFGEQLNAQMLVGSGLIVAAGLFILGLRQKHPSAI